MKIDFDQIVPKYLDSEPKRIASIVTDRDHVWFFLEECERYGIMWADGDLPTGFNPIDWHPDHASFRFVLFDNRRGESGNVELVFESYYHRFSSGDDIQLSDLIVHDDEAVVSADPPVPLDLSVLYMEVSE